MYGNDELIEFKKSVIVYAVNNDPNTLIVYFKDKQNKEICFTITKEMFKILQKAVDNFGFGQFMIQFFGDEETKKSFQSSPQVYTFDKLI